jgi:four helix bundle protein
MTKRKRMEIEGLALRFVRAADEVADRLPEKRDYLAKQLRRAASSVYLNLREGLGEFSPREKARVYRMSFRSLLESTGCTELAELFCPDLSPLAQVAEALANELAPQLHRLIMYQQQRRKERAPARPQ